MSVESVRDYLKKFNADGKVIEMDDSCATVGLAASTLGVEEARIAKTMSFLIDGEVILIVTAGDTKIDNGKYKREFKSKAKMVPFEETENLTGHAAGGVCPFAVKAGVKIYLDHSLKRFTTVPAAGSHNGIIELTLAELEEFSQADGWIDVAKMAEPSLQPV